MITIKKDLTDVKIADRKKQILNVIQKWLIEINSNKEQKFKEEFLSNKYDKYFKEIKESIGEFKEIKEMRVIYFLGEVIIGGNSKFKIMNELHEDYLKLRKEFYKKLKGGKK